MDNKEQKKEHVYSSGGRFLGALAVPAIGATAYSYGTLKRFSDLGDDDKLVDKFINYVRKKDNLKTRFIDTRKELTPINLYHPVKDVVAANKKNLGAVAHEFGHAKDFQKFRKLKAYGQVGAYISPLVGASLAATDNETLNNLAIPATLLTAAPTLRNEAVASLKGYKNLKEFLNKEYKDTNKVKEMLRKARNTKLIGFGSYASLPLLTAGGIALFNKKKKKEIENEQPE